MTILQESVARYFMVVYKNNYPTYHVYTPAELSLICLYFCFSLRLKKPYVVGGVMVAVAIILGVINTKYLQPLEHINSYYLLFEGLFVISLCLLSFYKILIRDDVAPKAMANYWITICFLFYWSLTYVNLGLVGELTKVSASLGQIFVFGLYFANLLFYLGIASVFIFYKKLIPSGE